MALKKPLILIPVENQVRELDAKLLLACTAARRGLSSIIGSKRELEARIATFPRSIYNILNPLFEQKNCLNCRDVFSEYSDIAVGDAWYSLPDDKGYSTVIIRTGRGKHIFDGAVEKGYIRQWQIEPEILYKSHSHIIKFKRREDWFLNTATDIIRLKAVGSFLKMLPLWLLCAISMLYRRSVKFEQYPKKNIQGN